MTARDGGEAKVFSIFVTFSRGATSRRKVLVGILGLCLVSNVVIAAAGDSVPRAPVRRSPLIEICKLIKHPSQYAGKTIRLKAILVENDTPSVDGGDPYLYGPACRKTNFKVLVDWTSQESYQPIANTRETNDVNGYVRTSVILVGTFHYSETKRYGHLEWADSQFIVDEVEAVKATPAKILY